MIENILKNDRRTIAKALTLVESTSQNDQTEKENLISKLLDKQNGNCIVVGFSGITGSGKSSLIEEMGKILLKDNKKVAVLAIDPSSPIHGGSILGDKTRMNFLSTHENCFVRPVPSKFNNGGISRSTHESIVIFKAAQYDYIFIETVGVGQTEYSVSEVSDCLIVNLLPATGDELQGVKKGINEVADIILINKCDGALETQAKITVNEYQKTLSKPILATSIFKNDTVEKILIELEKFLTNNKKTISERRMNQMKKWGQKLAIIELQNLILSSEMEYNFKNPYEIKKSILKSIRKSH